MNVNRFPSRIILELTPLCNLSCSMCPRHYINDNDGYMKDSLFRKLIDEITQENPQAIVLPFWRGESCLHKNFNKLLNYAINQKVRIHLSTNGHYVEEQYKDIFYQCEFLTFSIHTPLGFKNAKMVIDNKPKWCKTIFQISFVDSEKTTKKYLGNAIADSRLLGFDSVRLYKEHTISGEFGKMQSQVRKKRHFCPKLIHTFAVSSDGCFSRCNHIWETQREFNLNDHSIKQVWESEVMNAIRRNYPDKQCFPCDQWSGHTCGESWNKTDSEIRHKIFD